MGFEIDFLTVGDSTQGGDAIALRYGNLFGYRHEQKVVIIDGGTTESGTRLVQHIIDKYNTRLVDIVISTHPDNDHVAGLHVVLDQLLVSQLAIHRPWLRPEQLLASFTNSRITLGGVHRAMSSAVSSAKELESLAQKKGVNVIEPFAGVRTSNGELQILGPTLQDYNSLACKFSDMPPASPHRSLIYEALAAALTGTRPENDSSVITLLTIDGHKVLFTGDAGVPALTSAIAVASGYGIDLANLDLFQVPHHGSRRNFEPSVLNHIAAPLAIISAPIGSDKHPAQSVVDGLIARSISTYATRGTSLWYSWNAPQRIGYGPVYPLVSSSLSQLYLARP
jgi:beta-lactamase superfamily II metal-dependent hydrolase